MPVMLPRYPDVDMHRDGFHAATKRPFMPSLNADECTAHQNSNAATIFWPDAAAPGHDPPVEKEKST